MAQPPPAVLRFIANARPHSRGRLCHNPGGRPYNLPMSLRNIIIAFVVILVLSVLLMLLLRRTGLTR